jgi:hypothetical protein
VGELRDLLACVVSRGSAADRLVAARADQIVRVNVVTAVDGRQWRAHRRYSNTGISPASVCSAGKSSGCDGGVGLGHVDLPGCEFLLAPHGGAAGIACRLAASRHRS